MTGSASVLQQCPGVHDAPSLPVAAPDRDIHRDPDASVLMGETDLHLWRSYLLVERLQRAVAERTASLV